VQSEHFSTKCIHEERFPADATMLFIIPEFKLFLTGNLNYYANILRRLNSCRYWCPFCLISHPEWQESASDTGEIELWLSLKKHIEKKDASNN
jgi:hypothetical protein